MLLDVGGLAARLRPDAVGHPLSYEDVSRVLPGPFNRALGLVSRPSLHQPGRPKFTLLTPYFTWAGIDGMSNPFGLESIVHPDVLPFERPFVLAHEWAHLAGQADEAEANAIGWLACMQGDARLAYSGSMYLVVELGGALPRPVWLQATEALDPGVRADLAALAERWRRSTPIVRRTASHVYDRYLRANGVEDGVASYSRALSLILLPQFRGAITAYQADRDPRP
jgi:hypothetical protein